nr:tetratricopeptide repeat protein [Candidatus Shapirobacteria bacterium]
FSYYVLRITDYHKKIAIFASFLSILITNISGFSVVTISLFFFLLPLLAVDFPAVIPKSYFLNRKSKFLLTFILVSSFLFLVSKTISFYLADLAYSKSIYFDKHEQFSQAYQFASVARNLRPTEPTYLTFYSTTASKMAVSTKDDKYISQATDSIRQATNISPFDTNLLKQRAQIFYYLSFLDKNYYLETLNTLTHLTEISPTDPSNYYLLGRFYQNISETDRAISNYQQAIQLKSNYDHATFALGEIYFQQKKYPEAKPLLEATLQIAPTNLQAKDYLARIATSSGTK